ncbi:MAG: hypothetical protein D6820_16445 [Lentisphaerae bacterium]|nr:MAG: hypothetical protein D6820_16445 [Lentisphaerota bacterium]
MAGLLPPGYVYRLPTEAEWEYASQQTVPATLRGLDKSEWFWQRPEAQGAVTPPRHPIRSRVKKARLYDMLGNVSEWCWDAAEFDGTHILTSTYKATPREPLLDPVSLKGPYRIYRGGSVRHRPDSGLLYARFIASPTEGRFDLGFRIVLGPAIPEPSEIPTQSRGNPLP